MTIRSRNLNTERTKEKGSGMWIGAVILIIYVIAGKLGLKIREWLEILLAGMCLFFLFHI